MSWSDNTDLIILVLTLIFTQLTFFTILEPQNPSIDISKQNKNVDWRILRL